MRREGGFTLAEVLVATFVIAIGLTAVATGFQYAMSGVATGPAGPGASRGRDHDARVAELRRPMRLDLRRAMRLVEALRSERGFTLAELLVACVVVAFVMAGLFITLQSGQEVYLRGSNQV